jgi:hypothetical protein
VVRTVGLASQEGLGWLVHEVRGRKTAHQVHVDGGARQSWRGGVGGRLGRRDGARVQMEVAQINTEVGRRGSVHCGHSSTQRAHPRVLLFLDLDGFGELLVPAALVTLQLALQFGKRHAKHRLKIAHEAVDVAFPRDLVDDVLVVVVAEAATQFLVVHLGLILAGAPPPRHLLGVDELELPVSSGPRDAVLTLAIREKLQ